MLIFFTSVSVWVKLTHHHQSSTPTPPANETLVTVPIDFFPGITKGINTTSTATNSTFVARNKVSIIHSLNIKFATSAKQTSRISLNVAVENYKVGKAPTSVTQQTTSRLSKLRELVGLVLEPASVFLVSGNHPSGFATM